EPMNKNQDYRDELEKMINDKTLFGAHEYGPGYSPDLFINSNRLEGFQVSIYRDVPGGENKV
ncbi:MAG: hypothetical protein NTY66_01825, partial [Candidatus Vogelbacteria bacterium]|nr:hypothetical protein [Candidatus Vogelbacteria bacterium]